MISVQFTLDSLRALLAHNFRTVLSLHLFDVACALGAVCAVLKAAQVTRCLLKRTRLYGPSNPSFLWGIYKVIRLSPDAGTHYEKWAEEHGEVYEVPTTLGGNMIVLCDPKAIAHLYAREPWTYILMPYVKTTVENIVGDGILSAVGENHRRQRKTLAPGFSHAAIRNLTPVFFDTAYKAKNVWEALIESNDSDSTVIDVQNWMNRISLDTIGIAGFSHDFGSLDGKPTSVTDIFDALGNARKDTGTLIFMLALAAFPWLLKLPTPYTNLIKKLNDTMGHISNELLTKARKEKQAGTLGETKEKSILGLLVRAENHSRKLHLTPKEVTGLAKVLLVAGYEATPIGLTWALIELSRNPNIQAKLRAELLELGTDPTFDQLSNGLPYLDAVVHETLRIHSPVRGSFRIATEDDLIPLSKPVRTRSGEFVDHVLVTKGTRLLVYIPSMNTSTALWGPDSKEFKPERWISPDGIPPRAKEIQGHRHLLTFLDGPRTCLGKGFAIAEFKAVLSVLVKNFVFELRDGPETVIETSMGILPRPTVAGEHGVPLVVKRFEGQLM